MRWLLVWISLVSMVLAQGPEPPTAPPTPPSPEQIAQLIRDLGDDRVETRNRASDLLWHAGTAAEAALRKAMTSKDPEVVVRARELLDNLAYDFRPGLPAEVVELMDRFRFENPHEGGAIVSRMIHLWEVDRLMRLIEHTPNQTLREHALKDLLHYAYQAIPKLIVQENYARAEQLIEKKLAESHDPRDAAVFLLLRGQADAKLAEAREKDRQGIALGQDELRVIATLLRLHGDSAAAWEFAQRASDHDLQRGILVDQSRWDELTRFQPLAGELNQLGMQATIHLKLADTPALQKDFEALRSFAWQPTDDGRRASQMMLLLERPEQGMELLRRHPGFELFDLLVVQEKYAEALAAWGLDVARLPSPDWLKHYRFTNPVYNEYPFHRCQLGLKLVRLLSRMGKTAEADALLTATAGLTSHEDGQALKLLWEVCRELRREDRMCEFAATLIAQPRSPDWRGGESAYMVFGGLLPQFEWSGTPWWKFFCQKFPDDPRHHTARRVLHVFNPPPQGPSDAELKQYSQEFEQLLANPQATSPEYWQLLVLGETYLARGDRQLAREYFQRVASIATDINGRMQLAEMAFRDRQWEEAAHWYRETLKRYGESPFYLYMLGHALLQIDPASAEGHKAIKMAHFLPLGNPYQRVALAQKLSEHGLHDEAIREWEFFLQLPGQGVYPPGQSAKYLGDTFRAQAPLKAADYWEQASWSLLFGTQYPFSVEDYLRLPHALHQARAVGQLAENQPDAAWREIQLARASLPGEIGLAVELMPLLERAGRKADADALYQQLHDFHAANCREFPDSAYCRERLTRLEKLRP